MKTAWLALVGLGVVLGTSACEVSVGDSDDDGGASSRGGRSSGGASTSGGSTAKGGTTSSGGATSRGGATSSGGTAGAAAGGSTAFQCSQADRDVDQVTPASCDFAEESLNDPRDGRCYKCLQDTADCCALVAACYGTPDNRCAHGSDGRTEFMCFQDCIYNITEENGFFDDDDEVDCAASCATCDDLPGTISSQLIGCMRDNCEDACFYAPQ